MTIIPKRDQLLSLVEEIKADQHDALIKLKAFLETHGAAVFLETLQSTKARCMPGSKYDILIVEIVARMEVLANEVELALNPPEEKKEDSE